MAAKTELPIIEIGCFFEPGEGNDASDDAKSQAAANLIAAFETTGMAYLHFGTASNAFQENVAPAYAEAHRFFKRSVGEKQCAVAKSLPKGVTRGYLGLGAESGANTFERKEAFSWSFDWDQVGRMPENQLEAFNVWPESPLDNNKSQKQKMKETFNRLFTFMCEVMLTLIDAISLVWPAEHAIRPNLRQLCIEGQSISLLRAFHYLGSPHGDTDMTGSCEHTDWGFATLIAQQQSGGNALQVFLDGKWVDVPPIANTLVINCSDFLSILTNGWLRSPLHRVILTEKERTSFVFFQYPGFNTPIPKLSKEGARKTACLSLLKDQRASSTSDEGTFDLRKVENMSFGQFIALKWDQVSRT